MFDAIVALVDITYRIFDIYNSNERWVVKKMKSKYADRIVVILTIIY